MATLYSELYCNLLPKFKSYDIPLLTQEEVEELLQDYITPAAMKFHVCKKNLMDRDNDAKEFIEDLSKEEIDILSNFLLIEYVDANCIRVPTILKVSLPSSEFNSFSVANFLDKLIAMQKHYISINEGLLSRYAWFGMTKEQKSKFNIRTEKNIL